VGLSLKTAITPPKPSARTDYSNSGMAHSPELLRIKSEVRNDQKSQRRLQSSVRKGKNLGGPYKSKAEAEKRLRQVEFFKHRKG